jgi:F-type H+-transporting ATPase subunit alpha
VERQVAILWVVTNGFLDDIPTARVKEFEQQFYRFLDTERPTVLGTLSEKKALDDELTASLRDAVTTFKQSFTA